MKFILIVLRPEWFLNQVEGFETLQELQYAATVGAKDLKAATVTSLKEAFEADKPYIKGFIEACGPLTDDNHDLRELSYTDYMVLGSFQGGTYMPWLNGRVP